MKASEFVQQYAKRGYSAWEAAAAQMYRDGTMPTNPWVPVALSATTADGKTHSAVVQVSADYLLVGEDGDAMRLPLTPSKAQEILNLDGSLLPTPWLDYQIWRAAHKVERRAMQPNKGANLEQYLEHSRFVDQQAADWRRDRPLAGHKKDIVVSNIYKPGTVLIHGWYKPAPDVYDDGQPWQAPDKQPQQAKSNAHGDFYVDYSHGVRKVHPRMVVDGVEMKTEDVYRDPSLSALVSNEGPVRTLRYPAANQPANYRPVHATVYPIPTDPSYAWRGYQEWVEEALRKKA